MTEVKANKVADYFNNHSDIYTDFNVQFVNWTVVQVTLFDNLTEEEARERISEIRDIIYNAHLTID